MAHQHTRGHFSAMPQCYNNNSTRLINLLIYANLYVNASDKIPSGSSLFTLMHYKHPHTTHCLAHAYIINA